MASRLMSIYAEVKDAKKTARQSKRAASAISSAFPIKPPNISAEQISQDNKTKAQLKIGKVTEIIQPLQHSKNFAVFIVQRRY